MSEGTPVYETIHFHPNDSNLSWKSSYFYDFQVAGTVKLFSFFLFMVPGHDGTVDPASQDLFGPDCDSETPELLPVIPFQQSADPAHPQERPPEVLPHFQFLQALCALRGVRGDDHGLEPLWFCPDGDSGSLLADSVCQLLDSVVKACKDPPPLGPGDLVLQACRVVAQATDLFCSQREPSVEFKRSVESSLVELTETLLHRDMFSQVSDLVGAGGQVCVRAADAARLRVDLMELDRPATAN